MKPFQTILVAALVSIIAAYSTMKFTSFVQSKDVAVVEQKENSVYDRVTKSGELNCGYVIYSPYFTKDANTGKLGGIFYDITNELGKRLNLKINWSLESGWATFTQDVALGRVDAICSGLWADSAAARQVAYSTPLLFAGVEAYARSDDMRFDNNMDAINSADVRIATSDGSVSGTIGQTDFPQAKIVSLPNLSDYSQVIENVVTNKADVVFIETPKALEYLANNPGKIKRILPGNPVRIYRTAYALKQDDVRLKSMFDTSLQEIVDSGFINKLLSKYEQQNQQIFYRIGQPYQNK